MRSNNYYAIFLLFKLVISLFQNEVQKYNRIRYLYLIYKFTKQYNSYWWHVFDIIVYFTFMRRLYRKIIAFILCLFLAFPLAASASTPLKYIYDSNGSLVQGEGKYFEYDNANKLIRIRMGDKDGAVIAEYVYDHNGQRVKKTENGQTTYYIGKYFEEEFVGPNPGSTSYYFANNQRVARKAPDGKLFFLNSDHLGGTNGVTDAAGNLTEKTRYYPFGNIREGGNERYTYSGKELDKASNSYYFEARQYSAGFRHFTQADTIDPNLFAPQTLNRYAYVNNNPLKYVDPDGHIFETAWDILNVAMDVGSLVSNVASGNWGAAAVDAACLTADVAATVIPGVPGGAGFAIDAARAGNKAIDIIKTTDNGIDLAKSVDNGSDLLKYSDDVGDELGDISKNFSSSNYGIQKVGGRNPINSKYAGKKHPSGVQFNEKGFPDFKPYSQVELKIENLTGNYSKDAALANNAMKYPNTPKGYVWHHVEDGSTLLLIPQNIHDSVRHTGGSAVIRHGAQ
ncbi:RHS repeat-containing protein [Desulfonema limicola]|uniref:RHS repeat-containing protein n=1 Tax=Desulfonema limicola TaxID=45656 RepID=A0A975BEI3_9BACT|nr:RHS repeat-associated core domain-containing protein [Desulfonema limicola]QTA83810.1 RHS repeat-containing protein [Desulfonema limicola]